MWYIGARDREILRWTTEPAELTLEGFLEGLAGLDDSTRVGKAVVAADGRLAGNVAAVRDAAIAELSYWIAAESRGAGAATFALNAMTAWVIEHWPVSRLELQITPDNHASAAVAARCGYRLEGRRESCLACAGPDGTVVVYAREVVPAVC